MTRDPKRPTSDLKLQKRSGGGVPETQPDTTDDIASFVAKVRAIRGRPSGSGRLIFALDATMSRQPTWDMACQLQADMFREAGGIGGLDVRLVIFAA